MDPNSRYIIAEISDTDFDPNFIPQKNIKDYTVRKAARGILVREDKIAVLFVSKENYHKLPGGGIEGNESHEEAFIREVKEETGCDCKIITEVNTDSVVIETRAGFKLVQLSYVFASEIVGSPGKLKLEQDEIDEGFELNWVAVDDVIELLQNDKPNSYEGKFIQKRDLAILNFYQDLIKK